MRTIEELSNETYYNMEKYNQIVIDYVEKVEDVISEFDETELRALNYEITNLLDIYNPKFVDDVEVLNDLEKIIKKNIEKNFVF